MSGSSGPQLLPQESVEIIPCTAAPLFLKNYVANQELPPTLGALYASSEVKNEFQALCVVLHNLMLEGGYVLGENATKVDEFRVEFDYAHPAGQIHDKALMFKMTCTPLGPFVAINGLVSPCSETEEPFVATQVKLSQYVTFGGAAEKPENGQGVYKQLAKLSHKFKDTMAYKGVELMRAELKLPPLHGILSLFPEIMLNICSYLSAESLVALSGTCHQLHTVTSDNMLWRTLFIRDFGGQPNTTTISWKVKYKEQYMRRKEREEERRIHLQRFQEADPFSPVHPFTPQPHMPGMMPMPAFPGQPYGMIGGEHDLRPHFGGPFGASNPFGGNPFGGPQPGGFGGGRGGPFMPHPRGPRVGPRNPMPGARFDPFGPGGGQRFRPGRGGGMYDGFGGGGFI